MQDPSARLSAEQLLRLEFIANAQPPDGLIASIKAAIPMRRVVRGLPNSPVLGQTMPRWEFGQGHGGPDHSVFAGTESYPNDKPFLDQHHRQTFLYLLLALGCQRPSSCTGHIWLLDLEMTSPTGTCQVS